MYEIGISTPFPLRGSLSGHRGYGDLLDLDRHDLAAARAGNLDA